MRRSRQKGLPLSRAQRIKALKAIDYRSLEPPVARKQWANVLDLLIQVECCSGRHGTHASLETLASRMRETIGVSARTARRASKVAQSVGLLGVEYRSGRRSIYRILWDRAVALSQLDEETMGVAEPTKVQPLDDSMSKSDEQVTVDPGQDATDPGQTVHDPGQGVIHPGQNGRSYIRNNLPVTYLEPPPPTPSLRDDSEWAAEEEELLRMGMRAAKAAVRLAKAAGCTLADWLPHREHWSRHRRRWREPLGVLKHRLDTLRPGQPADQGWPPGEDPPATASDRREAAEQAERLRVARQQWRRLDQPRRLRVLIEAGESEGIARALLEKNTGRAEDRGVRHLATRLTRARSP